MRIGIYGGTFNPPHLGHLNAARFALETLALDKLLFVPAAVPPHKALPEGSPMGEQRLELLEIAVDSMLLGDKAEVSAIELGRRGKSYTADTLAKLHERYPDDELWFLMGSDMFLTLHQWYRPEAICSLARLAVFCRDREDSVSALEAQARRLREVYGANARVLSMPRLTEISSTEIRQALSAGQGSDYLPAPVYGYILRRRLYGTNADLTRLTNEELEACSLSMVYARRHAHIRGVAAEAVRLAQRWGADPDLAWRAGILHDCTKYLPLEEHLRICESYEIELDDMERRNEKLLHSKSGAALARHLYGQQDGVCGAIFYHTTGRPDMTLLEKILYLADYMEPNRAFDGVEELRRLCYEDLDAGLLYALRMSVDELTRRGTPLHPKTKEALDWAEDYCASKGITVTLKP